MCIHKNPFSIFLLLMLIPAVSGIQSCIKDTEDEVRAEEERLLKQYLKVNSIAVSKADGIYFIEQEEGSGSFPISTDWIELSFTMRLLSTEKVVMTSDSAVAADNEIFNENANYGPNRLLMSTISIPGLYAGLSKMKQGGKATMIIPSDQAYGNISITGIPAYSTLIFDVDLHHVIHDIVQYERAQMNQYLTEKSVPLQDSTSSGLYFQQVYEGSGDLPKTGNLVEVRYTGRFLNGRVFDATTGDDTYSFFIGYNQVIKGMEEGVMMMKKGGKANLIIPYNLAYGTTGYTHAYYGTLIWPYTTLVFEVELYDIARGLGIE